jgi:hypothetical protein
MIIKILILGVELPCTVYHLYKIIEHDYMYKSYVAKFLICN